MHWFQKQHSFSYRHILGLAKISSSSCFFKGLKGIKVSTRFRWAESPRCLSFEGRPPLPTHASSPLLPPPQVLKRAQAKAVPHQHSSSSPLPLTFSLRILRQLMSLVKYSHPLLPVKLSARHENPKPNFKDHFYANDSSKFISRPDLSAILFPHPLLSAGLQQLRCPPAPALQPKQPCRLHAIPFLVRSQPPQGWSSSSIQLHPQEC